jgi:hypothetical protein
VDTYLDTSGCAASAAKKYTGLRGNPFKSCAWNAATVTPLKQQTGSLPVERGHGRD